MTPDWSVPRVAIAMPLEYRFARQIVLGASKFCMTNDLALVHVDYDEVQHHPERLTAQGFITCGTTQATFETLRNRDIPVVNISSRSALPYLPSVLMDNVEIGRMGARHLKERGFKSLAYLGFEEHAYSQLRAKGFQEMAANLPVVLESGQSSIEDIGRLLAGLQKPLGVMTCNDIRSGHVLNGCRLHQLEIPHQVAIVGVDNDEVICQAMEPTLSSIDPNAYTIGYEAAAMVLRLMHLTPGPEHILVPPIGVVPRASTNTVVVDDPEVQQAIKFIYENGSEPIRVPDVASKLGVGRRTLERRFAGALGYSVAESIRKSHVERAKHLLIDTDLTVGEIAESCGIQTVRQLNAAIMAEMDLTAAQFRQRYQGHP